MAALLPTRAWPIPVMVLCAGGVALAQKPSLVGDRTDGSRARPVHAIPLRDADGEIIRPTDRPLVPFSPARTCAGGECHDVAAIARGWHFRTTDPSRPQGRRPEPWILVDRETATQVPVSYQPGAGAFSPEQVGLTTWAFALAFGDRTPGGIVSAHDRDPERRARWAVSGDVDLNCLACHDASPAYDHAEYGRQLRLENFRWAAAAASGLAGVSGAAREMPNSFDHLMPFVEDALLPRVPQVTYSADRFLPGAKVVFEIERRVSAHRCYACHSTPDVAETGPGRWNADEDIHLARGMTCVDCHRNGLDHAMTRGYEGEPHAAGVDAAALSCRGCHLATEPERNFARGRLGAPYPTHSGLPPVHFTKLSCTACHSGPRPDASTRRMKTTFAHRLGGLGVNKAPGVLPHISYPVFAQEPDGQTKPNRLLWPAYWGRLTRKGVTPIPPARVKAVMAKARIVLAAPADGDWPVVDEATVTTILKWLASDAEGAAVYAAGGVLRRLDASGQLVRVQHDAARPYLWPMAHDVRPAALALGARSCNDCHDAASPIFFGSVAIDSPIAADRQAAWRMSQFQPRVDAARVAAFARSFQYRPYFRAGASTAAAILILYVLAYATPGLRRLSTAAAGARWMRAAVTLFGLVACVASAASGWPALLSGERLAGDALMMHVAAAPALLVAAVLITIFRAGENAFTHAGGYLVLFRRISFWIAVVALVPATLSVTLAMFPLVASIRQEALFLAHRYSVVVVMAAGGLFAVLAAAAAVRSRTWRSSKPQTAAGHV